MNRSIFNGGTLEIQILNAEKYGGSQRVFGQGKYQSFIRVVSGTREVGRSIVEKGNLLYEGKQTKWGGYESNFRLMKILPTLKPSVRLVIYDCDREKQEESLGEAKLVLKNAISSTPVTLTLNIETILTQKQSVVGTILITAIFRPNPIPMYQLQHKISLNTKRYKEYFFGIGWDDDYSTPGYSDESFSVTMALFNTEGNHLESVIQSSDQEKKTIQLSLKRIIPTVEDGYTTDKVQLHFSLASLTTLASINASTNGGPSLLSGCVVLSILSDFQSLQGIKGLYCRCVELRSGLEVGRYCLPHFENPVTSCMMMRLERDPDTSNEENLGWCVRPHRLMDYTARSCGPLIPLLKSQLSSLFAAPAAPDAESEGRGPSLALPPLSSSLAPRASERIGYLYTAPPYTPATPQTFAVESFYDSVEGGPEYTGDFSFGIAWNQKADSTVVLDLDLGVVVLDNAFRIIDYVAGASPPKITKRMVPANSEGDEGEREPDEEGEEKPPAEPKEIEIEEVEEQPPPVSINGSLIHGGEISPERQEGVDDHTIHIKLKGVDELPSSTYIAIYSSSLTGRSFESLHIRGCKAHLFDSASKQDIISAEYRNTTEHRQDNYFTAPRTKTASGVILAILYKLEGKWYVLGCNVGVRGSPPEMNMDGIREVLEKYLKDAQPLQLQMRINAHNTTNVKRYGHLIN